MSASRYWIDLTTTDFDALARERMIALLPIGATEQHGPHLPLSVDSRIAAALVKRTLDLLPSGFPISILPMLHYGVSPEHADYPGTIAVSAETQIALLLEIGRSVAAAGWRKLAFLNTHGGQPQILDIAAQKLRRDAGLIVVSLNAYRYWQPQKHFPVEEAAYGTHAGAVETSIMLAIAPETVRTDAIASFASLAAEMEGRFKYLRPGSRIASFAWQAQDLQRAGAVGDARLATAEKGEAMLNEAAQVLADVLRDLDRLSPDVLRSSP
jgi:creatinine amidohydrolase